ncbi:MAG: hypothetical protein ABI318_09375 [Chthoniobacteraceae bacterium]
MSIEDIPQHEARRVRSPQTRYNDDYLRLGDSSIACAYRRVAAKVLADIRLKEDCFLI